MTAKAVMLQEAAHIETASKKGEIMKVNTSYVRVKGNDPFGDNQAAADFINSRAASAGYTSALVGESNSHCINFLEREISECAPEIRENLYIETFEEEVEE